MLLRLTALACIVFLGIYSAATAKGVWPRGPYADGGAGVPTADEVYLMQSVAPRRPGVMTGRQIEVLWVLYGGDRSTAHTAAAVALAESGGNTNAISKPNSDGTVDRGLFQINSVHGAHSTTDIETNVRFAVELSRNGTNWRPWTTYKTGAYRLYL